MSHMSAADFESRYRADPDPWNYLSSSYERRKYEATLEACGPGPFESALELGGSIGVFSEMLAPRCRELTTIDFSETAAASARARLKPYPHVRSFIGSIPEDLPDGRFDLVVASEILYYLANDAMTRTLSALDRLIEPGGRLVCVHWRQNGPDRTLGAAEVHRTVRAQFWLSPAVIGGTEQYLLDALDRK